MFSVVIPLYNKEHTIDNTLQCLLNQKYKNFEIIVVNDGSTDNGVGVVKKFELDLDLKLIHQENQGVSAARNRGVLEASKEYVAFLDADDELEPDFLNKIEEAINTFPNAGMYGTSSKHKNLKTGKSRDATLEKYKGKIQEIDFFTNPHMMPHTSAMVISKEVFNFVFPNGEGFPVGMKVCEDLSCFYRLAFNTGLIYVGYPLGIRNSGVEGQVTGLSAEERFKLLVHVVDFYNLVHKESLKYPVKKSYISFFKYDFRHRVIDALRTKDYRTLNYLLQNLNKSVLSLFSETELRLYKNEKLNALAKLYILFTKIIWKIMRNRD